MLCPVCKESMVVLELKEIEIDFCTGCNGIWLDAGELELMFESEAQRDKIIGSFQEAADLPEKQYKCPICSRKMVKIRAGDKKEIIIDKCKKEHGLWFDEGELKTVIESGSTSENKIVKFLQEMFESKISNNDKGENK